MESNRREFFGVMAGGLAAASGIEASETPEDDHEKKEKKTMDLEQARTFVKEAKVKMPKGEVRRLPACCIDGRHEGADCAIPGGDEGLMANVLAALNKMGITDPEIKHKAIMELVAFRGGPKNIRFHTDVAGEKDPNNYKFELAEGCGHFRLSAEKPDEYSLSQEDVTQIYIHLKKLHGRKEKEGKAHKEVLKGKHEETAIFIIDDEEIGLKHHTKSGQAFIYNRALHHKMLKIFAAGLSKAINVDHNELEKHLLQVAQDQLMATSVKLAKGQNVYTVKKGENGEEVVELSAKIPE